METHDNCNSFNKAGGKGAVRAEKQGKLYCYMPLITEKAYKNRRQKNLIQTLYNGSVRDLAVSLFEDNTLSDEDIADLRKRFRLIGRQSSYA